MIVYQSEIEAINHGKGLSAMTSIASEIERKMAGKVASKVPVSERHIRHHGLMIDASFNRDGSISHYVVEGGIGRFPKLEVAKEIAEYRALKKANRIAGHRSVNAEVMAM